MNRNRDLVTVRLYLDVTFDRHVGDAEGTAQALDTLLATALSTPGVLDDFGDVEVGNFTELPAAEEVAKDVIAALVTSFYTGQRNEALIRALEKVCLKKGPGSK